MKQVLFIIAILTAGFQAYSQSSASFQKFQAVIQPLYESLDKKDYSTIEPFIHEDFTYNTYGGSMGTMIMKQVVAGYPIGLKEIDVIKVTDKGDHYALQTIFKLPDTEEEHTLLVSKDFKLLKADVVKIQLAGHPNSSEESVQNTSFSYDDNRPEKVEIPLILQERDLFVEATINGKKGKFYFDTGAPSLILNRAAFAEGELMLKGKSEKKISGSTGEVDNIIDLTVQEIEVAGLQAKDLEAMSYDLSHLDETSLGMIGMDIMKGYLTIFNLKDTKLSMYKLNEEGAIKDPSVLNGFVPIEVKMLGHLPMITVEVSGQKLNLLVDSGAGAAMLHPKYKELLKGHYDFQEKDVLRGVGKEEKSVDVFNLRELSFGTKIYKDIRVLFENFTPEKEYKHEKIQVDGLIGWDIFYQSVVAYDLDNELMYVKD